MKHHYIPYKDIILHYTEAGSGRTLVFLHGFLENTLMWSNIAQELQQNYHIVCIDLLGHGKSGSIGAIHTMEDMADAVYAIVVELKIRKVTLVGHSMGGYVSLCFAQHFAYLVNQVILITSTVAQDSTQKKIDRDRAISLVNKNASTFIKMAIANMYDNETKLCYSQEIELQKTQALTTDKRGIINALKGMKERSNQEMMLYTSHFPIDYILGKKDPLIPYQQTLLDIASTSSKVESLNCGHMPQIETPRELIKAIKKLLT